MNLKSKIFQNLSQLEFDQLALQIFKFQYENNKVYRDYVEAIGTDFNFVTGIEKIPFLPIRFFKTHKVVCEPSDRYDELFLSSSTTGDTPSSHYVKDISLYKESFSEGFSHFYGNIKDYTLLALLPSYLERGNSSLVYMANELIKDSQNPGSGFHLDNYEELAVKLRQNEEKKQKTLLIGVTYALLKLAEEYPMPLTNTIIMETGGMKGRREELTRQEVHRILSQAFNIKDIHSEYGMTELLSQAYSNGQGLFRCVPWMRVLIRDIYDPFSVANSNQPMANSYRGAINIIDLANINSCSFIATDDIGIVYDTGDFEVNGRLDNSDIRGCNLMAM